MPALLCAPLHAPTAGRQADDVVRRINQINRDCVNKLVAVGPTEAYNIIPELRAFDPWMLVLEQGGKDKRRGQKDNPILVNNSFVSQGAGQIYGCDASTPERLAPERWFTFAIVDSHFIISMHPHAAVQAKDGGPNRSATAADRVEQFSHQMYVFRRLLQYATMVYNNVSVMGDMNCSPEGNWRDNPWNIMKQFGLNIHPHNIIGFGSNIKGFKAKTIKGAGTDHVWMLGQW